MFVVADVNARAARAENKEVCFPVAAHYSGVTAKNTCDLLNAKLTKEDENYKNKEKIYKIFSEIYNMPSYIIRKMKEPIDLLNFFSMQTLWDLQNVNVSCDYDKFYTTDASDFSIFVNTIFSFYQEKGVLIYNSKDELALNYDERSWKNRTLENLSNIDFIQPFHKGNVIGAFNNIRSDWGILREYGLGIRYKDKFVIDPMFDSELFTLYDLFIKHKDKLSATDKPEDIFTELLRLLNGELPESRLEIVKSIIEWLPCDLFVCEEHLKTWVVKKTYAETLLMNQQYHTKKYFITGMGSINNERMSSSRGTAVLLKDLIAQYGTHKARLIILMLGGHPSKMYDYDAGLPSFVDNMLNKFVDYLTYLKSICHFASDTQKTSKFDEENGIIDKHIKSGYYRQAIIHIMVILPKKYCNINACEAKALLDIFDEKLKILLPGFLNDR